MPTRRPLDPQIDTVFFPEDGGQHGGIDKTSGVARWFISDTAYDELINAMPLGPLLQQVPPPGAVIATLPSPVIWMSAQVLNQALYLFSLCTNGAIYQTSLGGSVTTVTPPGTMSANCDIANWQGTQIIFSDLNAAKVYAWNGSVFSTVFSSQPAAFITVYSNRLWLANQSTITFTAGGTYNNLGGDGGSFLITEMDCPPPIRMLAPYGGNLYVAGYNWIRIYGGLYDTGQPAVLQFQTSTLTDEAGLINKWSFLPAGYAVYYSSLYGIWGLLGSQPIDVSDPITGFFQNLGVANSSFSAAWGQILGVWVLCWNVFYASDSTYRIMCLVYNPNAQTQLWFSLNQGNIAFITYGVDQTNGQQKIFGVDTAGKIYQICGGTGNVTSKINTKLWCFGTRIREKTIIRAGVELIASFSSTVALTAVDESLNTYTPDLQSTNPTLAFIWYNPTATFAWSNAGPFTWSTLGPQYKLMEFDLPITVKRLGLNLTLTGSAAAIGAFAVEYTELPADWGA
jgi:hypothetical protein